MKDAECAETNEKSIFRFFAIFDFWNIVDFILKIGKSINWENPLFRFEFNLNSGNLNVRPRRQLCWVRHWVKDESSHDLKSNKNQDISKTGNKQNDIKNSAKMRPLQAVSADHFQPDWKKITI